MYSLQSLIFPIRTAAERRWQEPRRLQDYQKNQRMHVMKKYLILFLVLLLVFCSACGQSSEVPLGITIKEKEYDVDNLGQPCIKILCEQLDGLGTLTKDGVDASGVKLSQIKLLRKNGNDWDTVTQFFDELSNDLAENQSTTVYLYPKQLGDKGFEPLFLEEGAQYVIFHLIIARIC